MENIGIIIMAMGAATVAQATGREFMAVCVMSGALLHTLNHSLFKTLLFFGAGNVSSATGTTSLDSLGGVAGRMPVTAALFLLGTVAICALPPLNGFCSEFMIYYGLFDALNIQGSGIIIALCGILAMSLIGGVVILAFTKLYGVTFSGTERSHEAEHASEVGMSRIVACMIPVAGIVFIGLAPAIFAEGIFAISGPAMNIEGAQEMFERISPSMIGISATLGVLVIVVGGLLLLRNRLLRKREQGRSAVWGCGFGSPSAKMQYTGESFSEGLSGMSSSSNRTDKGKYVIDKYEIFPTRHSVEIKHGDTVSKLFSEWWVAMTKQLNKRIRNLNTGKVNHYVLYALALLVLILFLSVLKII